MQIISPMKKTLCKVFVAPHFDAGRQSAAIPIRHMKFDFEPHRLDHRFYMNAELAEYMMKHEQVFFTSQDEKQRDLDVEHAGRV